MGNGFKESIYRQQTIRIPPNSTRRLNFNYESFKVLSSNLPDDILFRFANQNSFTKMEAGLGFNGLSEFERDIEIKNPHETETAIVVVGIGTSNLTDSRLVISGALKVETTPDTFIYTVPAKVYPKEPVELVIGAGGFVEVSASDYSYIRLQNIGGNNMRLYGVNGFVLCPMGVEELNPRGLFKVYGTAGDKLIVGGFE